MSSPEIDPKNTKNTGNYYRQDHLVVTQTSRVVLFVLIVILALAVVWAFFGSIPINIQGRGLIVNEKGLLYNVNSKISGIVRKVNVKPGDFVTQGAVLVEAFDPQEEIRYKSALASEAQIKSELETLKGKSDSLSKANLNSLQSQIKAAQSSIEATKQSLADLQKDLPRKQELLARGIIKADAVDAVSAKITNANATIATLTTKIAELNKQLVQPFVSSDLKAKERELATATQQRQVLEVNHANFKIVSPSQGKILEVMVNEGEPIDLGKPIVWMEYADKADSNHFLVKGFFPIEKGKSIVPGMDVQIEVSTVDPKEYGYLKGKVKEVSPFAVSRDSIMKTIHNQDLVNYLTEDFNAVIETTIEPVSNPDKPDEYLWSTGSAPDIKITTGTVCHIEAQVQAIRPIYYVIPLGRFKMTTARDNEYINHN